MERGTYDDSDPYLTYVDVEPNTGLTMRAHKRLQYTIKLKSSQFDNPYYQKLYLNSFPGAAGTVYLPAFWADESEKARCQQAPCALLTRTSHACACSRWPDQG